MSNSAAASSSAQKQQEQDDEMMARRLQQEYDQEQARIRSNQEAASRAAVQQAATAEVASQQNGCVVACPACTFNNDIKNPNPGRAYKCHQCHTPLVLPESARSHAPDNQIDGKFVQCSRCGKSNLIPADLSSPSGKFVCGGCYCVLSTSQSGSAGSSAPGAAAQRAPTSGPAVQRPTPQAEPAAPKPAEPPQATLKTVQVRCGQCSAVNAVDIENDATAVQFECGSCHAINEVNLN